MKRLLTLLSLALAAATSFGATLNPVQLLNPAGSTPGQAIVSTGPSSAPAWGNVTATGLSPVAANSVIANFTGSTAAPVAFSMPTCSAAGRALQYSGSGIVCTANYALTTGTLNQFAATTSAQLAGIVSDETGSGSLVFGTSPTISGATISGSTISNTPISGNTGSFTTLTASSLITPSSTVGVKGTATNDSAQAGSIGEYATNTTSGTPLTTATGGNCTSVSLTAGDWDVSGTIRYIPASTTVTSNLQTGITTTSGTLAGLGTQNTLQVNYITGVAFQEQSTPVVRMSLASTTTVFLAGIASFTTSTMTCNGFIRARRVR